MRLLHVIEPGPRTITDPELVVTRSRFVHPSMRPWTSPKFWVEVHHQLSAPAGDSENSRTRLPCAVK